MAIKAKTGGAGQGMTLSQIDELGKVPQAELDSLTNSILKSICEAEERKARASAALCERSEHLAAGAPPPSNTGVKSYHGPVSARLVLEGGEVKEIPARRGWGGSSAFIDWLNFTVREETFWPCDRKPLDIDHVKDETLMDVPLSLDLLKDISQRLEVILGFGITAKRETGANFYRESWVLGDAYGMVCHGGQRHTVLVMLNGTGCAAAKEGWEGRLQTFLESADSGRITRIDLAHDCHLGEVCGPMGPGQDQGYSVNQAMRDYHAGLFNAGGRHPNIEQRGNWIRPNGKGRTVYIGSREGGKFCRVYEKGCQLGDKDSEWTRIEVEMKAVHRIIPFDVLTRPGEYLAASYPAFAHLSEQQERILTTREYVRIVYEKACAVVKKQYGAYLSVIAEIEGGAERMLAKLRRDDLIPAFSKIPDWRLSPQGIHATRGNPVESLDATVMAW